MSRLYNTPKKHAMLNVNAMPNEQNKYVPQHPLFEAAEPRPKLVRNSGGGGFYNGRGKNGEYAHTEISRTTTIGEILTWMGTWEIELESYLKRECGLPYLSLSSFDNAKTAKQKFQTWVRLVRNRIREIQRDREYGKRRLYTLNQILNEDAIKDAEDDLLAFLRSLKSRRK